MKKINTVLLIAIVIMLAVSAFFMGILLKRSDNDSSKVDGGTSAPPAVTDTVENSNAGNETDGGNSTEIPGTTAGQPTNNEPEATAGNTSDGENSETTRPEGTLEGLTICLDAGHQLQGNTEKESCAPWSASENSNVNSDTMKAKCTSGTTGAYTGIPEYVTVLDISKKIEATLESYGAEVVMVRDNHDVNLSNIDRAQIGNEAGADVTLRIHCNGSDNSSVSGIDLYTRGTGDGSAEYIQRSNEDYEFACELIDYIVEATGAKKRNVTKTDTYTGINWSEVPCIIIECGFMSNETEDNLLNDAEYQQKIANGIANWLLATELI